MPIESNHHHDYQQQHRHHIHVTNFSSNECITYGTILLKGTISDCCSYSVDSLRVKKCGSTKYFPCTDIKRCHNTTGSFKCLIELCPGENAIKIDYCNSTTTIRINYNDSFPKQDCFPIIKLCYVICHGHDGCFQSDRNGDNTVEIGCRKIDVGIQLIQCLMAEKLKEAGFPRKTFQFSTCQAFQSAMTVDEAHTWSPSRIWNFLAREFVASDIRNEHIKYVGFLACTSFTGLAKDVDYTDQDIKANTRAHIALGAGDVALFGTGCLYTWPQYVCDAIACFDNKQLVNVNKLMDDSNSRRTYGGCFATTLGSLCHEMGHIFDLGHTANGIMGNGFDFVNRVFTHEPITVMLPRRMVNPCQHMGSSLSAPLSSPASNLQQQRLTQLRKKNKFLEEYQQQRDNDLTFFCDNSNVMLFYHKWFNEKKPKASPNSITFDQLNGIVTSGLPLRLIELRDSQIAMAIHYIAFKHDQLFTYKLPSEFVEANSTYDIVILDDDGNIVKFSKSPR